MKSIILLLSIVSLTFFSCKTEEVNLNDDSEVESKSDHESYIGAWERNGTNCSLANDLVVTDGGNGKLIIYGSIIMTLDNEVYKGESPGFKWEMYLSGDELMLKIDSCTEGFSK